MSTVAFMNVSAVLRLSSRARSAFLAPRYVANEYGDPLYFAAAAEHRVQTVLVVPAPGLLVEEERRAGRRDLRQARAA